MALPIYLELDINVNQLKEPVLIKQYNTGEQELIITVTESGKKYILDNNIHTCTFKMLTPDNREIFNNSVINDDGTVSIIITSNCTAVYGTGMAELNIFNSNNFSRVSTMSFYVNIKKSVYPDEDILGTNEYTALTNTLLNSSILIHEMENLVESVNEAESKRVIDEGTRCSNEDERIVSENERKTDEETRQINEYGETLDGLSSGRVYNENQRILQELIREKNEHGENLDDTGGRVYAELQRVKAENQRVANELERQKYMSETVEPIVSIMNEKITLATTTITNCEQSISNANIAIENANNVATLANDAKGAAVVATTNANTATQAANQAINRMQELIADLENKVLYCC